MMILKFAYNFWLSFPRKRESGRNQWVNPRLRGDDKIAGQTMIEFSFCMIVVAVILFGMIKVFVWTGRDLIARREAHETILTNAQLTPERQFRPVFYYSTRFNAAIDSDVYK